MTDVIAHRGASRLAPENTTVAFRTAVSVGADGIELDARRTADGVIVVHHDARLADGRVIVDTPWRELPEHVPTLGAALDACAGAWVNVEIKNSPAEPDFDADDRVAVEVLATLAERGAGRWLISSLPSGDRRPLPLRGAGRADGPAGLRRRTRRARRPGAPRPHRRAPVGGRP